MTAAALGVGAWSVRNWIAVASLAHDGAPISTAAAEGTVLVTGATGFIGRRLTAALLAQQRRVIVLTRDRLAARAQFGPAPLIVESLDELPDELDGGRHRQPRRRQRRRRTLDDGAAARAAGEPRGDHAGARRLRRAAAARARRAGERLGGRLLRRRRPDAAGRDARPPAPASWPSSAPPGRPRRRGWRRWACGSARCASAWCSTGPAASCRCWRCRRGFGLGARIGDGRQWAPWIHRDDAVRMILAAIDDPAWRGPVNAVAPDLVTQGQMTRRLAAHFRRPQFAGRAGLVAAPGARRVLGPVPGRASAPSRTRRSISASSSPARRWSAPSTARTRRCA